MDIWKSPSTSVLNLSCFFKQELWESQLVVFDHSWLTKNSSKALSPHHCNKTASSLPICHLSHGLHLHTLRAAASYLVSVFPQHHPICPHHISSSFCFFLLFFFHTFLRVVSLHFILQNKCPKSRETWPRSPLSILSFLWVPVHFLCNTYQTYLIFHIILPFCSDFCGGLTEYSLYEMIPFLWKLWWNNTAREFRSCTF